MTTSNRWVVRFRAVPDARLRLFCLPYAGGGASVFRPWTQLLPPWIEVCAVQLPGRETRLREPLIASLPPLIDALEEGVAPLLDRPFALFGYSMGAIIAFEFARRLRQRADFNLCHLFVAARGAPQTPMPEPPLYNLPEAAFIAELRRLNGTPEIVFQDAELRQLVLTILRADFAVNETYAYTPEAPLAVPLTALGGARDPRVRLEDVYAWEAQTSARFSCEVFDGEHFFITQAQAELLRILERDLQRVVA